MKTNNLQKGTAKTSALALGFLVLFIIIFSIVYHFHRDNVSMEGVTSTSTPVTTNPSYTVSDNQNGTTNTYVNTPNKTVTTTRLVSPFPGGVVYHNSTYSISVPLPASWAGYTVSETRESFAGVSALASLHFNVAGTNPLTINVFTKEQWNDIRIQETNGQVNSFGEGNYLGENSTYIFATNSTGESNVPTILNAIRFF